MTSVLVNGCPTEEFSFFRGLRQGDPLSPFLFLLAAEGLHVLMTTMVEACLFEGYRVGTVNLVVCLIFNLRMILCFWVLRAGLMFVLSVQHFLFLKLCLV